MFKFNQKKRQHSNHLWLYLLYLLTIALLTACGASTEEPKLEFKSEKINFRYQNNSLYWNAIPNVSSYVIQSADYGTSNYSLFYTHTPSYSYYSSSESFSKSISTTSKHYRIRACFGSGKCTEYSQSIVAPPINGQNNTTSSSTQTKQGNTTGGELTFTFAIPSGVSAVSMTVQLAGDFASSSEYSEVSFNNNKLGNISSDKDGSTLITPSGWQNKTINSTYWSAGQNATIKFDAESGVNFNYGGFKYKYQVTLHYTNASQSIEATALDLTNVTVVNTDSWLIDNSTAYSGGNSLKSPTTSDSQSKCFQITAPSNATSISFYWRVSSEYGFDKLRFYINGTEKTSISGTPSSWSNKSYSISTGNAAKWCYTKDGSHSIGSDTGWVDKVSFQ